MLEKNFSPFKTFDGEVLQIEKENDMARNLWIVNEDVKFEILRVVNKHLYLNSKLIVTLLIDRFDEEEIRKNLKLLKRNSYLRAGHFVIDSKSKSTASVYFLGWRGSRELRRNNIALNRYNETEKLSATQIKEVLAANQLMIAKGITEECEIRKPIFTGKFMQKIFRTTAFAKNSGTGAQILLNSVRGTDIDAVREKASRVTKVLNRKNCIAGKNIELNLICESPEHLIWVKAITEPYFKKLKGTVCVNYFNDLDIYMSCSLSA